MMILLQPNKKAIVRGTMSRSMKGSFGTHFFPRVRGEMASSNRRMVQTVTCVYVYIKVYFFP